MAEIAKNGIMSDKLLEMGAFSPVKPYKFMGKERKRAYIYVCLYRVSFTV
jgi:hypothetical protein